MWPRRGILFSAALTRTIGAVRVAQGGHEKDMFQDTISNFSVFPLFFTHRKSRLHLHPATVAGGSAADTMINDEFLRLKHETIAQKCGGFDFCFIIGVVGDGHLRLWGESHWRWRAPTGLEMGFK